MLVGTANAMGFALHLVGHSSAKQGKTARKARREVHKSLVSPGSSSRPSLYAKLGRVLIPNSKVPPIHQPDQPSPLTTPSPP